MAPLPFPAAEFLADPAVRLAISRKDYEVVVALLLMACAGWQSNHDRGSFPDDPERVAAIVGLPSALAVMPLGKWSTSTAAPITSATQTTATAISQNGRLSVFGAGRRRRGR